MYDLIGKSLGKYHIIELIDETAGTEIYKGFNPAINRYVVINVLKQAFLNNDAVLRRFLAQNDIAAKIHHPHIAQFFDFGVENGIHYRVFLYGVNGRLQDNKHWFNQREPMLGLVSDLSSALGYIHQFGYVHLNINPRNIYLDEKNKALLGDFGLVKTTDLSGIDPYDSPEVRNNLSVDARADVYSLGVLVYELITGAPPNPQRIISPRSLRPDIPADVEKVIFKALSNNPADRFQTTDMFNAALTAGFRAPAFVSPGMQPTVPMVQVPVVQVPVEKKNNTVITTLLTLLFVALVGIILFFALSKPSEKLQPTEVPAATAEATALPPPDPTRVPPSRPDRPDFQWPDISLPDWEICKSVQIPAAMALAGVFMSKSARKRKQ